MVTENIRDYLNLNKPAISTNINGLKLPNKRSSNGILFISALMYFWEKHLINNTESLEELENIYKIKILFFMVWRFYLPLSLCWHLYWYCSNTGG